MLLRTRRGLIEFGRARLQPRDAIARIVEQMATTPAGLRYLRGALVEATITPVAEDISAEELLQQIAVCITEGTLAFVFLRPYEAPTPGFIVEGDAAVVVTEQKNEAGDLKPAPEVPPEYPVLARAESDQVVKSTTRLVSNLAALLFNTFGRTRRQSTIARTLITTASEQSMRILSARQTTDVSLEVGKWPGGGLGRPKPSVPVEYKAAAKSTGEMTKFAIDKLSATLGPHDPSKSSRPAPSVPSTYVQVASGTASSTKSAITSLGSSFAAMFRAEPFVRPRPAVPPNGEGE